GSTNVGGPETFLKAESNSCDSVVGAYARRQQFAAARQHRIGGGGDDMGVDRLEVAQSVKMQRTGLRRIDPPRTQPFEMRVGCVGFQRAERLLLGSELTRGTLVASHEQRS